MADCSACQPSRLDHAVWDPPSSQTTPSFPPFQNSGLFFLQAQNTWNKLPLWRRFKDTVHRAADAAHTKPCVCVRTEHESERKTASHRVCEREHVTQRGGLKICDTFLRHLRPHEVIRDILKDMWHGWYALVIGLKYRSLLELQCNAE